MGTAPNQINVEYFFRLIYDCFVGACTVGGIGGFLAFLAHLWVWIGVLGILLSCAGIALIVYCLTRLFQLRQAEEEKYGTLHLAEDQPEKNPRFARIEELMRGESASQWREAIIEADIMMGDALTKQCYGGTSIADQLGQLTVRDFVSLEDAWEAHKVRNQIAHQGSAFALSRILAQRTIARYENVFREFGIL